MANARQARGRALLGALFTTLGLLLLAGCGDRPGTLPGYVEAYGFNSVHGRALPIATGIKVARPELNVVAVGGDGDVPVGGLHVRDKYDAPAQTRFAAQETVAEPYRQEESDSGGDNHYQEGAEHDRYGKLPGRYVAKQCGVYQCESQSRNHGDDTEYAENSEAGSDENFEDYQYDARQEQQQFPMGGQSFRIEGSEVEYRTQNGDHERKSYARRLEFEIDASDDEYDE